MIRYFVVNSDQTEIKVDEVENTYWFSNPIKREGFRHKKMVEIIQISHWKGRSLSYSDTCIMDVYTYGEKKPISINGWNFPPTGIKAKYALTAKFCGMELWFKCTTPEGKDIVWYYNERGSACPHEVIKSYFHEIRRISEYPNDEVARRFTFNEPNLHVRH